MNSPYREVLGNKIVYFDYDEGSNTEGKEVTIDLEEIWKNSKEIGKINYQESPIKQGSFSEKYLIPLLISGFILLLLALGGWRYAKLHKKRAKVAVEETDDISLVAKLLAYDGQKLSTEEFDRVLGIDEITNFDSKRIKRARLIKGINLKYEEEQGRFLISRIKNPEDKRFVFYKISF